MSWWAATQSTIKAVSKTLLKGLIWWFTPDQTVQDVCQQQYHHLSPQASVDCASLLENEVHSYLPSYPVRLALSGMVFAGLSLVCINKLQKYRAHRQQQTELLNWEEQNNPLPEDYETPVTCPIMLMPMQKPCWVVTGNKRQFLHYFDMDNIIGLFKNEVAIRLEKINATLANYGNNAYYWRDIERLKKERIQLQQPNSWRAVTVLNPLNKQPFTWQQDVYAAPDLVKQLQLPSDQQEAQIQGLMATHHLVQHNKRICRFF